MGIFFTYLWKGEAKRNHPDTVPENPGTQDPALRTQDKQ
jgi:hypothetical protein